ncbi:unnamed protein product, partial [Ectocarpus sp. 12 AP-2014]
QRAHTAERSRLYDRVRSQSARVMMDNSRGPGDCPARADVWRPRRRWNYQRRCHATNVGPENSVVSILTTPSFRVAPSLFFITNTSTCVCSTIAHLSTKRISQGYCRNLSRFIPR